MRITAEIAHAQRQVNTLLYRRVPGELVDAIEDEIVALRTRLMNNDVALMMLVEQARRANEQRPERHRLDLDAGGVEGAAAAAVGELGRRQRVGHGAARAARGPPAGRQRDHARPDDVAEPRPRDDVAVENLPEGTEVALVNPEKALKEQKGASDSPMGIGQ